MTVERRWNTQCLGLAYSVTHKRKAIVRYGGDGSQFVGPNARRWINRSESVGEKYHTKSSAPYDCMCVGRFTNVNPKMKMSLPSNHCHCPHIHTHSTSSRVRLSPAKTSISQPRLYWNYIIPERAQGSDLLSNRLSSDRTVSNALRVAVRSGSAGVPNDVYLVMAAHWLMPFTPHCYWPIIWKVWLWGK